MHSVVLLLINKCVPGANVF